MGLFQAGLHAKSSLFLPAGSAFILFFTPTREKSYQKVI